ncbi:MAG TPA: PDZ domain-containing protein, partial [Longimicrobium sp.]
KFRGMWLPLLAALALPGALRAQDDDCPCRRPGMIGVSFDDSEDVVRIVEVRRGSPAARAGIEEGDVVIRLNGEDAGRAMSALPGRLEAGDTVRLRIRRDGGEREVVVVAEPRPRGQLGVFGPGQRFEMIRPGGAGNVVIINGDSMNVPLEALTFRIDSLRTQLMELNSGAFRVEMDSLVRLFGDSASVWSRRIPNVRFRMREGDDEDIHIEGRVLELDEDVLRLRGDAMRLQDGAIRLEGALGQGEPFFMELGRRSAAGAELAEMNEGLSAYFGGQRAGALVIDVSPESPAARAGLQPGDVIVRAGGQEVEDPADVRNALTRAEEGRVALEVIRRGRRQELSLEWTGATRMFHREVRPMVAPRVRSRGQN